MRIFCILNFFNNQNACSIFYKLLVNLVLRTFNQNQSDLKFIFLERKWTEIKKIHHCYYFLQKGSLFDKIIVNQVMNYFRILNDKMEEILFIEIDALKELIIKNKLFSLLNLFLLNCDKYKITWILRFKAKILLKINTPVYIRSKIFLINI